MDEKLGQLDENAGRDFFKIAQKSCKKRSFFENYFLKIQNFVDFFQKMTIFGAFLILLSYKNEKRAKTISLFSYGSSDFRGIKSGAFSAPPIFKIPLFFCFFSPLNTKNPHSFLQFFSSFYFQKNYFSKFLV